MRIASKPFNLPTELVKQIKFISPNVYELNAIAVHFGCDSFINNEAMDLDDLQKYDSSFMENVKKASEQISSHIDNLIITFGANGLLMTRKKNCSSFYNNHGSYIAPADEPANHRFYHVKQTVDVVNVSGAGDSFNVGFITAMINGCAEDICVSVGMECAKAALHSTSAVPDRFFTKKHACWSHPTSYTIM